MTDYIKYCNRYPDTGDTSMQSMEVFIQKMNERKPAVCLMKYALV